MRIGEKKANLGERLGLKQVMRAQIVALWILFVSLHYKHYTTAHPDHFILLTIICLLSHHHHKL